MPAQRALPRTGFLRRMMGWTVILAVAYVLLSAGTALYFTSAIGPSMPLLADGQWERNKIKTEDGVELTAWFRGTGERSVVVLAHDHRGSAGQMNDFAHDLADLNFDVLTFDFRGHGQSSGFATSMGQLESRDVEAVLNWLKDHGTPLNSVSWVGHGVGADAFLLAPSAPKVRSAVLIEPYSHLEEVIAGRVRTWFKVDLHPAGDLMLKLAHLNAGFALEDTRPLATLESFKRMPLMMLYDQDHEATVPAEVIQHTGNGLVPAELVLASRDEITPWGMSAFPKMRAQIAGFLGRTLHALEPAN